MTGPGVVIYPSVEGAESPWEFLDHVREHAPVYQLPDRPNLFVVTRYEDVRRAFSEPELFSSTGTRSALYGFDPILGTAPEESRLMTEFDPPKLKLKRDLGFVALKPGQLKSYEPLITEIVEGLIDTFADRGRCEFIDEFARALPTRLTVKLMGVTEDQVPFVQKWTTTTFPFWSPRRTGLELIQAETEVNSGAGTPADSFGFTAGVSSE
jgi:cytochrome P450